MARTVKAIVFPVITYAVSTGLSARLRAGKSTLLNCGLGGNCQESLGLYEDKNQSILKEMKPRLFTGKTDSKTETQILWSHNVKRGFRERVSDAEKDQRQTEMVVVESRDGLTVLLE